MVLLPTYGVNILSKPAKIIGQAVAGRVVVAARHVRTSLRSDLLARGNVLEFLARMACRYVLGCRENEFNGFWLLS